MKYINDIFTHPEYGTIRVIDKNNEEYIGMIISEYNKPYIPLTQNEIENHI